MLWNHIIPTQNALLLLLLLPLLLNHSAQCHVLNPALQSNSGCT
jgi:hypothetical protein